jgi:hypothetical protein
MSPTKTDIRNAANYDLVSSAHSRVYHEILERIARTGDELEARSLARHYLPAVELRALFAATDWVNSGACVADLAKAVAS